MNQVTYLDFDRFMPNEQGKWTVSYRWHHSMELSAHELLILSTEEANGN